MDRRRVRGGRSAVRDAQHLHQPAQPAAPRPRRSTASRGAVSHGRAPARPPHCHGPATEPVTSEQYEADGYWRGPIWAPSTALIEDGLRSYGFTDLADTVNPRFRALCERSGFAESFDACTGAGLRDRAYTWTAAVYLLFAADYRRRNP